MLPEELSTGMCSLNPHEDRLVMSVAPANSTPRAQAHRARRFTGVIRSAERMTYTLVNDLHRAASRK